jgi:uncharacterized protein YjdB
VTNDAVFESLDEKIATVDDKGIITGVQEGTTKLRVTYGDKTVEVDIRVKIDECFIATAAYGSKFQSSVVVLRQFRDQHLLTNKIGSAFVNFYYKNSPPVANFIAHNESLKTIVRVLLVPFVAIAYLIMHMKLLIAAALAVLVVWRRARKLKKANQLYNLSK